MQHFVVTHYLLEVQVYVSSAIVVHSSRIAVIPQHIHPDVPWIPVWLRGRPSPNQVIQVVVVCQSVIHDAIQLYCLNRSLRTPPEPLASCFMERPPNDGDFLILQFFQLHCNCVNIPDCGSVLSSPFGYTFFDIKISIVRIESASSQTTTHWGEPVPMKANYSFPVCLFVPVNCVGDGAIICRLPVVPRIVWGVVLHIEGLNEWVAADLLHKIVVVEGSLA